MGTRSPDNFGNDDAADWAFSVEKCTDLKLIETGDAILFARANRASTPGNE